MTKNLSAVLVLFISGVALAAPAQIIIIRHGEKAPTGNELDQKGCQRAFALPSFFSPTNAALDFKDYPPAAIYAMNPKGPGGSVRPMETITPTAAKLGLKIQNSFTRKQFSQLRDAVMTSQYDGKTVILSWEHTVIPEIASTLGLTLSKKIKKWPGAVFDEAWVLKFSKDGKLTSFDIVPEHVLPGDNPLGGKKNWRDTTGFTDANPPCPIPAGDTGLSCSDGLLDSMMATLITNQ
jgi:hypothetical protein